MQVPQSKLVEYYMRGFSMNKSEKLSFYLHIHMDLKTLLHKYTYLVDKCVLCFVHYMNFSFACKIQIDKCAVKQQSSVSDRITCQ